MWSEPRWVSASSDVYAARYKWYKETLDAAYNTYSLVFDYVSAVQNERAIDTEWIKYLSAHLKSETDCPYEYSKIKIVAADELCTWNIADMMFEDEELLNVVDVLGSHYTSSSTDNAKKIAKEYGKELWFSEGCSSAGYAQGIYRFDGNGSGLTGINGVLDIATRIVSMYPCGAMTMCQYQPIVAAYYDGVTYSQKQFILANEPWSGYYYLDSGFSMSLHFSQFIKKVWAFIDGACSADGTTGGDGHAIIDAEYCYVTAADMSTGNYSTVITNTTAKPITYNFSVSDLDRASADVSVWETRGPNNGSYDENYLKKINTITPTEKSGKYLFNVTVKPFSMVTVSTAAYEGNEYYDSKNSERNVLSLPYTDDYEYAEYPADYLSSRGFAPRYTTDEGGAFEVREVNGNNVLMQIITPETKSNEWGGTPAPTTNFGDDRWYNYSISADVNVIESENPALNYAGIGLRYNLADSGESGYWVQLFENGLWKLNKNKDTLSEGSLENFSSDTWTNLKIEAIENRVNLYINRSLTAECICVNESLISAGRAAYYSSYNNNCFDNLVIEPIEGYATYIDRYDDTDLCFTYSDNWTHSLIDSFRNYKRTISSGKEGAVAEVIFNGTGFALTGNNKEDTIISVKIDGIVMNERYAVPETGDRETSYYINNLECKNHIAEITVISGAFNIDSVEVIGE